MTLAAKRAGSPGKMTTTRFRMAWVMAALLGGCGQPEVSETRRKEAALLAGEAQTAITLRDWARAEGLLAKAAETAPDTATYWTGLGAARVRLGNKAGAKTAYERALDAYAAEGRKEPKEPDPWLKRVTVLALLGRTTDARELLAKTQKEFPGHRDVKAYAEGKALEALLADPEFRKNAL